MLEILRDETKVVLFLEPAFQSPAALFLQLVALAIQKINQVALAHFALVCRPDRIQCSEDRLPHLAGVERVPKQSLENLLLGLLHIGALLVPFHPRIQPEQTVTRHGAEPAPELPHVRRAFLPVSEQLNRPDFAAVVASNDQIQLPGREFLVVELGAGGPGTLLATGHALDLPHRGRINSVVVAASQHLEPPRCPFFDQIAARSVKGLPDLASHFLQRRHRHLPFVAFVKDVVAGHAAKRLRVMPLFQRVHHGAKSGVAHRLAHEPAQVAPLGPGDHVLGVLLGQFFKGFSLLQLPVDHLDRVFLSCLHARAELLRRCPNDVLHPVLRRVAGVESPDQAVGDHRVDDLFPHVVSVKEVVNTIVQGLENRGIALQSPRPGLQHSHLAVRLVAHDLAQVFLRRHHVRLVLGAEEKMLNVLVFPNVSTVENGKGRVVAHLLTGKQRNNRQNCQAEKRRPNAERPFTPKTGVPKTEHFKPPGSSVAEQPNLCENPFAGET